MNKKKIPLPISIEADKFLNATSISTLCKRECFSSRRCSAVTKNTEFDLAEIAFRKVLFHKESVTMKPKRFSKIFIVLVLLFSPFGSSQHVSASPNSVDQLDAVVVNRDLTYWDATYFGFVDSAVYENWRLVFTAPHNFIVTAVPISGDLAPLLILLDANGNELARGTRSMTSSISAGNYSVPVQPESGSGPYMFTMRETFQTQA
ncbi:MAG: hypothetical protein EHM33_32360, partial [Chloroflexi bacterium]